MESINWENVNLQGRFLKRFQKEIQNIINKPPEGIKFIKTLKKEEIDERFKEDRNEGEKEPNFVFYFEVSIKPDKDSIYEDGIFHVIVKIPEDYPFSPPECFMKTPIYHPNIYEGNGHICLNTLSSNISLLSIFSCVSISSFFNVFINFIPSGGLFIIFCISF